MEELNTIIKKIQGNLSPEEEAVFRKWLNESERNQKLFSHFLSMKEQGMDYRSFSELDIDEGWLTVNQKLATRNKKEKGKIVFLSFMKYAAAVLILFGVGYLFVWNPSPETELSNTDEQIILRLNDGTLHAITASDEKLILDKKGNVITTQKGEQLNYNDVKPTESYDDSKLVYNTLNVPYGKRFDVVLSDGTRVHLNSGSSLKYPVSFLEGRDRLVYVDGEAYFEVAKDVRHPFIVNAKEVDIRVTGTEFNVSCYLDDTAINTVLVEGSVELMEHGGTSQKMEPGELASWHKGDKNIALSKVDTEVYTGWKDGILVFKHMKFKDIQKKLERHYNVSITNDNRELGEKTFTARFENSDIEHIIRSFQKNFTIEYSITDDHIEIK